MLIKNILSSTNWKFCLLLPRFLTAGCREYSAETVVLLDGLTSPEKSN